MESGSLTRRDLLGSLLKASAITAVSSSFARAQSATSPTLVDDLVAANRTRRSRASWTATGT
jgi:hypothetical protein